LSELFPENHRDQFERVASELTRTLCYLSRCKKDGKWYFYHGDLAPVNIALRRDTKGAGEQALVFDFEYASASPIREYAQLCDLANLYGRCWPNETLHDAFTRSAAIVFPPPLFQAMVVMGTLGLTQYPISDPNHPEFEMARTLLERFEQHLDLVDNG
jgi:hypothetical protein